MQTETYSFRYLNTSAEFDGQTLTISRGGFGAALHGFAGGPGRGAHTVPLRAIQSVEIRDGVTSFYVIFRVFGAYDVINRHRRETELFGWFQTSGLERERNPYHISISKSGKSGLAATDALRDLATAVQEALAESPGR